MLIRCTRARRAALTAAAFAATFFPAAATSAAPIGTKDRVVVLRVGDGTRALGATGAAAYLEEYSILYNSSRVPTDAIHRQTIALPNTGPVGTRFTIGGNTVVEGGLETSGDGQYLMLGGYDAPIGGSTSGGTARRVVGRLDMTGTFAVDALYGAGNFASGNAIRSIISGDGDDYWVAMSPAGIHYRPWTGGDVPATTSTQLNTLVTRRVDAYDGQLYVSAAIGGVHGIAAIGSGMPTTAGQPVTLLSGFPSSAGPSPMDFFFANATTLYVADDRAFDVAVPSSSKAGGLQKWVLNGGTWTLAYTKNIDTTNDNLDYGIRGLSGSVDADGHVVLFATTTYGANATANFLVGIGDTLGNTDPNNVGVNLLASAAGIPTADGNLATFRGLTPIGVAVPEPAVAALVMSAAGLVLLNRRRRRRQRGVLEP